MLGWFRRLFVYRDVPLSELTARYWRAQGRAALSDQHWPMLRQIEGTADERYAPMNRKPRSLREWTERYRRAS